MSGLIVVISLIVIIIALANANKQKTEVRRIDPETGQPGRIVEIHETGPGPAETIARSVLFLVIGMGLLGLIVALMLLHC